MNILFITTYYPDPRLGGIERVTQLLGTFFSEQGHNVYCLHFSRSEYDNHCEKIKGDLLENIKDSQFIESYLRSRHIHVIINQSHFFYTPFISKIAHSLHIPVVFCLHSDSSFKTLSRSDVKQTFHGIKRQVLTLLYPLFRYYSTEKLKRFHKLSFCCADKTVLLSESLLDSYRRNLKIAAGDNRLAFINNPLSFSEDTAPVNLHEKKHVCLIVARMYEPQKRIFRALKCWSKVEKEYPVNWTLKLVGEGVDLQRYKSYARQLGIKNISFEGSRDSYPYYKEASLFFMTSQWEGFPMTLLECLQMGVVPLVMNTFPAARDLVIDGKTGYLIEDEDIDQMAGETIYLMKNTASRHEMAQCGLNFSKRFGIESIGKQWINLLNEQIQQ